MHHGDVRRAGCQVRWHDKKRTILYLFMFFKNATPPPSTFSHWPLLTGAAAKPGCYLRSLPRMHQSLGAAAE